MKKAKPAQAAINGGIKKAFPKKLKPMLATLVNAPFDEPGWLYEVKWDGYRAVALVNKKNVELLSRNDKCFNDKFYPVYNALQQLNMQVVLDGEIVVINNAGMADFSALQEWRSEADGELRFYVFDILWANGYSLMELPLTQRRKILKQLVSQHDMIHISETFDATGTAFFKLAQQMGLEGIMAKKADSIYTENKRTTDWLKIKTALRHEVVIGGFTNNEGSNKAFSSLLVGVFKNGKLHYTGKIGTGFTAAQQQSMMEKFKPLATKKCPFITEPDINKPSRFRPNPPKAKATWLRLQLVCEVSYREITGDGVMRHPSFEGMREDKPAASVQEEKAVKPDPVTDTILHQSKVLSSAQKKQRQTLLNPADDTQVKNINGHSLKFSNLKKIYWPQDKVSKRDLINYYYQVAPFILPYIKHRPQSLNRFPNGIDGLSFYQKDVTGKVPAWIDTFPYESEGEEKNYMVCNDEATLLYMASLGCIEINPWNSTVHKPDNPDWCVIDLDPDKNPFEQVIETANVTKQILDAAKVDCYCKTSGSTGLHIYIPLGTKYTYEDSKEFGRVIARLVHEQLPAYTSIERLTGKRKGKLYIDFLQNRPKATLATAYSLRPKPGATVSMPLHWHEVKKGLKMSDHNIHNAVARIKNEGDIFKPVLGKGINMQKALKNLMSL